MPTVIPHDNIMDLLNGSIEPSQNWTPGAELANSMNAALNVADIAMENIISDFDLEQVTTEGTYLITYLTLRPSLI